MASLRKDIYIVCIIDRHRAVVLLWLSVACFGGQSFGMSVHIIFSSVKLLSGHLLKKSSLLGLPYILLVF